jgi:hypothetical protein
VETVAPVVGAGVVVVFVVELPAFFFAFGVVVVCAGATDPATKNALTQKLAANFKYLFIDPSCTRSVHPSPRGAVDTTSESTIPAVAATRMLWYKQSIPVCLGRFEFHAEWLRDEPFDATTTGQNKGVPVSTLSCESAGNMRFGASSPKGRPVFQLPGRPTKRKVKKLIALPTRKEHHELFV